MPPVYIVCDRCGARHRPAQDKRTVRFCSTRCATLARSPHPSFTFDQGRWFLTCQDGSKVAWARVLMEGHLGRPLRSDEIVHHINEDPTDDRIENLEITTRAAHIEIHRQALNAVPRTLNPERALAAAAFRQGVIDGYRSGLTCREIAARLGRPVGSVHSLAWRLRREGVDLPFNVAYPHRAAA